MKVALLGAPGSEKTKIARRISRRLNTDHKSWSVVDGYVDRLRSRTGREFGQISTLEDNLMVHLERRTLEDEIAAKHMHSITCGSIYETIIYTAARSMNIPFLGDEQWVLEENYLARIAMESFGVLEQYTFDYDALFYLPLKSGTPDTDSARDWNTVVDAKLGDVLEGFYRGAVRLDGTDYAKVNRGTEIIRTITQATADTDEQAT